LADYALDFVDVVQAKYDVAVIEFAGTSLTPAQIASHVVRNKFNAKERRQINMVAGWSAGGSYAFEIIRCLKELDPNHFVTLLFLDAVQPEFVPHAPSQVGGWLHGSFQRCCLQAGCQELALSELPHDVEVALFVHVLHSRLHYDLKLAEKLVAALASDEEEEKFSKWLAYRPAVDLPLDCPWIFVTSTDSTDSSTDIAMDPWRKFFVEEPVVLEGNAVHAQLQRPAASALIKFLHTTDK
jgi:thioesterase domain-containing protein